jgi:hypothetical protein
VKARSLKGNHRKKLRKKAKQKETSMKRFLLTVTGLKETETAADLLAFLTSTKGSETTFCSDFTWE